MGTLLVEDGVDCHSCLTRLTITNNELTLATIDWHQRIDRFETCLHGLAHRLAGDDAGGLDLDPATFVTLQRAFAVDGLADAVDNTAKDPHADRDVHDSARPLYDVALLDDSIISKHHDPDRVGLEVERHPLETGWLELHHFTGLYLIEAVHTSDTIADGEHTPNLVDVLLAVEGLDAVLQDGADLRSTNCSTFCGALEFPGNVGRRGDLRLVRPPEASSCTTNCGPHGCVSALH